MKNWDWKHTLLTLCGLGALVCLGLADQAKAGEALPWHMTAGGLVIAASAFGYLSKQLGGGTPETKQGERGMASLRALAIASLVGLVALAGLGANCQPPTPQTVTAVTTDVTAGLELAACMVGVYGADEGKTPPAPMAQVVIDEGTTCGADVGKIIALFGATSAVGAAALADPSHVNAAAAQYHAAKGR